MSSDLPAADLALHPALVLGVYGEELASGARAAIFGSAALGLAEELVLRGARLVHVYDPDAARVAEATARRHERSIFYAALPDSGDVGVRDGAFDFVVVPDLSFVEDVASLLALVRRVLSPTGAALISSPNPDASSPLLQVETHRGALGYYELYEAIAEQFASVRMLGQAPFVGYAVAEFSVEDPEPTIDTSLAESDGKDPDWFVVLASDRNVRLEPFALIELPKDARNFGRATVRPAAPAPTPQPEGQPASEGRGTVLVNILEAEREAALESLRQQEQVVKEERFRADRVGQELAATREDLALAKERCRAMEARLEEEEARRIAVENELESARNNPELATLREQVRTLDASTHSVVDEHERELSRLETQLRDRAHEIQELRAEVIRREKLVRELLTTNLAAPAAPPAPPVDVVADKHPASNGHEGVIADLSARLDKLASEAAKREADLTAAQWKIAQLERERGGQR